MENSQHKQLLINYLLGICTNREQEEVEKWLDEDPENISMLQKVAKEIGKSEQFPLPRKKEVKRELMRKVGEKAPSVKDRFLSRRTVSEAKSSVQKRTKLWLKIAAVFLVISTAGVISVYLGNIPEPKIQEEVSMKQSTMSYGQTATLRFGDGSKIQMNSGSTLRYPESFGPDRREVYLEGEAFFTVEPDESRPFIVHAGNTSVRVLGTSFNIKAYENDDDLQIAVAEGLVAVTQSQTENGSVQTEEESIMLEKNQWLTLRSVGSFMEKGEGNIHEMIAWKDRVLVFSNKSFDQAAKMLERWYGVEIVIEDPGLKSQILEGEHRDMSLQEVINSLQLVMNFEYELDENRVRIY